jgi:hypothetical protein
MMLIYFPTQKAIRGINNRKPHIIKNFLRSP